MRLLCLLCLLLPLRALPAAALHPSLARLLDSPCSGYAAVLRHHNASQLQAALVEAGRLGCAAGATPCGTLPDVAAGAAGAAEQWNALSTALQTTLHLLCQHEAVQMSLRHGRDGGAARRAVAAAVQQEEVQHDESGVVGGWRGGEAGSAASPAPTLFGGALPGPVQTAHPPERREEDESAPPEQLLLEVWPGLAATGWAVEMGRGGAATVAEVERKALSDLLLSLAAASPGRIAGAPRDHCAWEGVTCGAAAAEPGALGAPQPPAGVLSLRLPRAGLVGTLPAEPLSRLRSLQLLDMSHNPGLRGELSPALVAALPRLRALALRGCRLGGSLPPQLPGQGGLAWLDLSSNQFSGSLPEGWRAGAVSIQVFNISHNALSGTLPSWLGELEQLKALSAAHNRLSGGLPPSLLHPPPPRLALLDVSNNFLDGSIPPFPPLTAPPSPLRLLDLSHNRLSGGVPSPLPPQLRVLALADNALSGPLPSGDDLGGLAGSLRHLDLARNAFSGRFPDADMIRLTRLTLMDVSGNAALEGHLPGGGDDAPMAAAQALLLASGAWDALETLSFSDTRLGGSLPPALFHRRGRLRELRGARCALGGSLPCAQLAGAVGLGHLDVAENGIEGKLCRGMAGLPGLTWLSLGSNKLEGAIPLALATLPSLRLFNVSGNERLSWVEFV